MYLFVLASLSFIQLTPDIGYVICIMLEAVLPWTGAWLWRQSLDQQNHHLDLLICVPESLSHSLHQGVN